MTERPPALHDPHPAVVQWHPVDGMPTRKKSPVGISTPSETHGIISSGAWEGR